MAKDKHTGGEDATWEVYDGRLVVDGASRECVGKAMRCGDNAETEANARLMAAAPAMLRALRAVCAAAPIGSVADDLETALNAAAKAISRATGGEG